MPMPRRRLIIAMLGMALSLLLAPAASQAAPTVFGSRLKNAPSENDCEQFFGPCTIASFIHPSEPNGDPYSGGAPVSGVITKFRVYVSAEAPGSLTLQLAEVSRPNPMDQSTAIASIVAAAPPVAVHPTPEEPEIEEFATRLPVKAGQQLAVESSEKINVTYQSGGEQFSYLFSPPLTAGGGPSTSHQSTGELLVQAAIEPDADGDGFGDETQDQCPTQKTTQGPCDTTPPTVTGLGVNHGTVSYSLSETSTVTFQLAKKLRGRKAGGKCVAQTSKNKAKPHCTRFKNVGGPFGGGGNQGANQTTIPGGNRLRPGTYLLTMTAVDVAGNTATKTITIKVIAKKKKRG
ncbi:MAG: hypothetical protein WB507_14275 [Solirubrobacterales bacterium]